MAAAVHTADLSLPCGSRQAAEWVRRAIVAETDEAPEGARCDLRVEGPTLRAALTAEDLAGLRAGLNTVVRLADAALRTVGAGRGAVGNGPAGR